MRFGFAKALSTEKALSSKTAKICQMANLVTNAQLGLQKLYLQKKLNLANPASFANAKLVMDAQLGLQRLYLQKKII